MSQETGQPRNAPGRPSSGNALKRVGLGSITALVSVNIWTGAPLLALWVGSKAQGNFSSLSMGAVALTVVVLAIAELGLLVILSWANVRYDEMIGRPPQRRRYPWLSSMRGERQEVIVQRQGVSAVERIIMLSVAAGVLAFEFWFFFLAGSSLPNS
jgi:hypothetical protein